MHERGNTYLSALVNIIDSGLFIFIRNLAGYADRDASYPGADSDAT